MLEELKDVNVLVHKLLVKIYSITSSKQIYKLKTSPHKYVGEFLILLKTQSLDDESIGYLIIITKKIGNSVLRNKIRRRLKSLIRSNLNWLNAQYDYLFIAKREIAHCKYSDLSKEFVELINC